MNWYAAKIVFQIDSGSNTSLQFDEQLRLISAPGKKEALQKARETGKKEESSFLNHQGKTIYWRFIDVADLVEIDQLKDGVEVYSRIKETDYSSGYVELIKQKASQIEMRSNIEVLNSWY